MGALLAFKEISVKTPAEHEPLKRTSESECQGIVFAIAVWENQNHYAKRIPIALNKQKQSSCRGSAETNLTSTHEDAGSILALLRGLRSSIAVSCGVGHRHGSDLALLWLWRRLAATALIQPPSLGTSICHTCSPKTTKKKKKT